MLSGIGFGELAVICIVLILAVGPERLPSMMRTLGKTMRTLRQTSRDIRTATGIDEMMRDEAFDLRAPMRKPEEPVGLRPISREQVLAQIEAANAPPTPPASPAPAAPAAPAEPQAPPSTADASAAPPASAAKPSEPS